MIQYVPTLYFHVTILIANQPGEQVNTQSIPSPSSYASKLPSGRDIHAPPGPYVPPMLEPAELERLRGPIEPPDYNIDLESSEGEDDKETSRSYY